MTELTKPDDCNTMDELRHQIDKLDIKIVGLLAHRSDFIDRATELKNLNGIEQAGHLSRKVIVIQFCIKIWVVTV